MRLPRPTDTGCYVGLLSGTSVDAVDAVLAELGPATIRLVAHHSHPIPDPLRDDLLRLGTPGAQSCDVLDLLGAADRWFGELLAEAVTALLAQASFPASAVTAIGSHGQTVRHRPPGSSASHPFSLQIGDPNALAARTGIPVVADFRRRDLAFGGQGAPLVPPFHQAAFAHPDRVRAIVNVGGIANLTLLTPDGGVAGFDIGPGNALMDAWVQRHQRLPFDDRGRWAAACEPDPALLARLQAHPFFACPPPKSTGREEFHLGWLDGELARGGAVAPGTVQATLLELTATSIGAAVQGLSPTAQELYLCGGGAYNAALLNRLRALLPPLVVGTTAALGLAPEWVEAVAFAWLARETLLGRPGNLPAVTGAARATVLGALYPV